MGKAIKVLMLEDVPEDAELQGYELRRMGFDCQSLRVDTEADFRNGLAEFHPDLVLSDFSMPGFNGLAALTIAQELHPDIPFIFVSGTIGEERAIESFKKGATDYVLKTNLSRLEPVIRRALQESEERAARREAERAIEERDKRFRAIVETTQEWIWEIDRQGRCTFNSPYVQTILGYGAEELLNCDRLSYLHPEDRTKVELLMSQADAVPRGWTGVVLRWRHRDGSYCWLESNALPLLDSEGKLIGYRGADRDVSERIRQQEKIAGLSRIHAVLSETNATIVRVHDRLELFRQICRIIVEEGGFQMAWVGLADAEGAPVKPIAIMGADAGYLEEVGQSRRDVTHDQGVVWRAMRDKSLIVVNDIEADPRVAFKAEALSRGFRSLVALPLQVNHQALAVLVIYANQTDFFDEQELKLLNDLAADVSLALDYIDQGERLNYLSSHDLLTGLPNRALFVDRLGHVVRAAGQENSKVAVLVIDLERFSNINDTLGRSAGDEILALVAQQLKEAFQEGSNLARIGGDCFAVAVSNVKGEAEIAHLVEQKTIKSFIKPATIGGEEIRISVKVGVALFPNDGEEGETLTANAEAALKKAKRAGERYSFYASHMHERIAERLTLENQLRRALEEEQFVLHYQPKINCVTGAMAGMEALIRWQSPELGLVPPGRFVHLLEETGLIVEVGQWLAKRAALDYWKLRAVCEAPPRVAINVSALQLKEKDFVDQIARAIEQGGNGALLDVEVTESLLMDVDECETSIQKLSAIREMGLKVALDDFGTGFSSLSYLIRLPIDYLKIDRSFIINIASSPDCLAIVSAVISLAHSLNLKVVAEGVETAAQANLLKLLKCDEIQGYFYSKPVTLATIEGMLLNSDSGRESARRSQA